MQQPFRRYDTIAISLCSLALVQLCVGATIVYAQQRRTAPPAVSTFLVATEQEISIDRLKNQQVNQEARIAAIEAMHLPERMAVLEKGAEDAAEVRRLQYGVIAALIASLLAQVVQIRGNRRNDKEE